MQRRETLLGSHVRGGLSRPVREDHVPVGIVLPKDPAQPVTRANAGIVLGILRSRVPGVARLGRWGIWCGTHRHRLFRGGSLQDGRNPAPDGVWEVAPLV